MKKLALVFAAVLAVSATALEAKRLGSGKSTGAQRPAASAPAQSTAAPAAAKAPAAPAAAAAPAVPPPKPSFMQKWGPMLGGLALGGLLGSMLGGMGGLGGAGQMLGMLLNLLLVGGIVYFAVRWWKNRQAAQQPAYAGMGNGMARNTDPALTPQLPASGGAAAFGGNTYEAAPAEPVAAAAAPKIPADFDVAGFTVGAKAMFNRLQTAHDKADLSTLKDMLTEDFFKEASVDLKGAQQHQTEVVTLDAEVLEVVTEGDYHWASVRFTGLLREDGKEIAENFNEVWNLQKPVSGTHGWILAGIQQV
jgi:predicted lipid-binding transport protein (Tim44 family)